MRLSHMRKDRIAASTTSLNRHRPSLRYVGQKQTKQSPNQPKRRARTFQWYYAPEASKPFEVPGAEGDNPRSSGQKGCLALMCKWWYRNRNKASTMASGGVFPGGRRELSQAVQPNSSGCLVGPGRGYKKSYPRRPLPVPSYFTTQLVGRKNGRPSNKMVCPFLRGCSKPQPWLGRQWGISGCFFC